MTFRTAYEIFKNKLSFTKLGTEESSEVKAKSRLTNVSLVAAKQDEKIKAIDARLLAISASMKVLGEKPSDERTDLVNEANLLQHTRVSLAKQQDVLLKQIEELRAKVYPAHNKGEETGGEPRNSTTSLGNRKQ